MAEPVVAAVKKYREEFENTFNNLRQKAVVLQGDATSTLQKYQSKLQQLQPTIDEYKNEYLQVLQDVNSPIADVKQANYLMESLLFATAMQVMRTVFFLIVGTLLSGLVGVIFDELSAIVLAYILLPTCAVLHIRTHEDNSPIIRAKLLAFAAFEGALVGFLLSDSYLSAYQPPAFLFTGVLAVAVPFASEKFATARVPFLGATVGGALGTLLVFGIFTGNLSFGYLLMSLGYAAVGFVTVQLYLKYVTGQDKKNSFYAIVLYFAGTLLVQGLVFFLLGVDGERHREQLENQKAAAASKK